MILTIVLCFYIIIKKSSIFGYLELYKEYFILRSTNKIKRIQYADIKDIERIVFSKHKNQIIFPIDIKYTIKTNKENIKFYSSLFEGFEKTTFKERLKQKLPDYSMDNIMFQLENMMSIYRISKI